MLQRSSYSSRVSFNEDTCGCLLDKNKSQLAHITNETQLQKCNDIYSASCQQTHMHYESFQMWIKTKSVCESKFPDPEETWFGRGAARWLQFCSEEQTGSSAKGEGERKSHYLFLKRKELGNKKSTIQLDIRILKRRMLWKTLVLLLFYYSAHATVTHRWSRGKI